jgi:hypothetical protein
MTSPIPADLTLPPKPVPGPTPPAAVAAAPEAGRAPATGKLAADNWAPDAPAAMLKGTDPVLAAVLSAGPSAPVTSAALASGLAKRQATLGTFADQAAAARAKPEAELPEGRTAASSVFSAQPSAIKALPLGPASQEARAKLSPTDQKAFDRVAGTVQNNFMAHQALQTLLKDGRLTTPNAQGHTMLGALNQIAAGQVHPSLNAGRLVGEVLEQTGNPASIQQGAAGTCAATSAQIAVARENPAEYAHIIAGLASPKGTATLAGQDPNHPGQPATLQRVPGTEKPGEIRRNDELAHPTFGPDGRPETDRLFQSAAMQLGHGNQEKYDAKLDGFKDAKGNVTAGGLKGEESAALTNALGVTHGHNVGLTTDGTVKAEEKVKALSLQAERLDQDATRQQAVSDAQYGKYKEASDSAHDAYETFKQASAANVANPTPKTEEARTAALSALDSAHQAVDRAKADLDAASNLLTTARDKVGQVMDQLPAARADVTKATEAARPELAKRVAAEVAKGKEVQVGLKWFGDGAHKVLVTDMNDKEVTYNNPQGRIETMTRQEFDRRVRNATLDD